MNKNITEELLNIKSESSKLNLYIKLQEYILEKTTLKIGLDKIDEILSILEKKSYDKTNNESLIKELILELDKKGISKDLLNEQEIADLINKHSPQITSTKENTKKKPKKDKQPIEENELEEVLYDADKLTKEMEYNLRRIFNYSGYTVTKDDTHFYVQNKLTKKQDKIIFYKDFNHCYFESNPENKVFINISLDGQKYGTENISSIDGKEVYFEEEKKEVIIRDSANDITYQLYPNKNNELSITKIKDNNVLADDYSEVKKEIDRLIPGIIAEYIKEYGIKDLEKINENINDKEQTQLDKKEELIDELNERNLKEFNEALKAQQEKDIRDASMKIAKSNTLTLDIGD